MAIPDFQSLMLPVLKLASDGLDHLSRDARERLSEEFGLTDEEQREPLLSGQSRFYNRILWALHHLKMAGLIASSGRGTFHITEQGLAVLGEPPARIDLRFLSQFPEYKDRRGARREEGKPETSAPAISIVATPMELVEAGYKQLREALVEEVLQQVRSSSWQLLEHLVVALLLAMGYGALEDSGVVLGKSGDGGVDGVINEDALGLDAIYLQAKRQEATVGRPQVQAFVGSLEGRHANKGVFITTSDFTREAREYLRHIPRAVRLINGPRLAELMVEYGVGVSVEKTLTLKRLDADYFLDPDAM